MHSAINFVKHKTQI